MEEWLIAGLLGVGIGYTLREGRKGFESIGRGIHGIPVVGGLVRTGERATASGVRGGTRLAKRGWTMASSVARGGPAHKPARRIERVPVTATRARSTSKRPSTTTRKRTARTTQKPPSAQS